MFLQHSSNCLSLSSTTYIALLNFIWLKKYLHRVSMSTYSIPVREGWHLLTAPLFPLRVMTKLCSQFTSSSFFGGKNTQNKTKNAALVTPWANARLRWMTRGHYRKQTLPILVIWNLPQENCLWEVSQCVGASSTSKITSRTLFRHHLSPGIYLKLFPSGKASH